jgi:hypothetical protein
MIHTATCNVSDLRAYRSSHFGAIHLVSPSRRAVLRLRAAHISRHRKSRIRFTASTFITTRPRSNLAPLTPFQEKHNRKVKSQHTNNASAQQSSSIIPITTTETTHLSIIPNPKTPQLSLQPIPTHLARLACMTKKATAAQKTTSRALRIQ